MPTGNGNITRKIALTRPVSADDMPAQSLSAAGFEVIHCPLIAIAEPESWAETDESVARIDGYRWIVFTSARAVKAFAGRAGPLELNSETQVACVGRATLSALAGSGLASGDVLLPQTQSAEGLLVALQAAGVARSRVLFPCGDIARDVLSQGLRALHCEVDCPVVYRTTCDTQGAKHLAGLLENGSIDAVAFASPSAVNCAAEQVGVSPLRSVRNYSIGPSTTDALERHGLQVAAEASPHDGEGLAEAIIRGESAVG